MSSCIAQYYCLLVARRATAAVTNKAECQYAGMTTMAIANLQTAALGACSDNANTSYGATFVKKGRFTTILTNENPRTNHNNSHRMLNSSQKKIK